MAEAAATDLQYPSGVNEKPGGATDRNDPQGRLRLLEKNAAIYRDIIPQIVRAAPQAVLVAVADPPNPLDQTTRARTYRLCQARGASRLWREMLRSGAPRRDLPQSFGRNATCYNHFVR